MGTLYLQLIVLIASWLLIVDLVCPYLLHFMKAELVPIAIAITVFASGFLTYHLLKGITRDMRILKN
jgi:hypothetical protein